MENITLGEVVAALAVVVGLITSVSFLLKKLQEGMRKMFDDQLKAIDKRMDSMESKIDKVDFEATKNYLVQFFSQVEKGDTVEDIEIERFHEQYDHYIANGGNSYIRGKFEKLKERGML